MTIDDKRLEELKYWAFKIEDYLIEGEQSEKIYRELVESIEVLSKEVI